MSPKDADGMASVHPDQHSLFAQAYLSKNLGPFIYFIMVS